MAPADIRSLSLNEWLPHSNRPLLIAGPCGVESESQIHAIASGLKTSELNLLRGGIWKPRTRPGNFQGIGMEALYWLKDAGKVNGIPVTVEVASPQHVEEALKAGIDVLWIGARTTVNPFLVQDIADSLRGVDIPVMIKNPINPDLDLWMGAFERMNHSGINKLIAIHRGFSTYEKVKFRYAPNWQIPIELKRRFPFLPLVCDPSHIGGKREFIQNISQTALDLNYDGLMVEVHPDPQHALSDKDQQLTIEGFKNLIHELVIRQQSTDDVIFLSLIEELRDKIDLIDEKMLQLMAERFSIAKQIGEYKKENSMTILQVERWKDIIATRQHSAQLKDINYDFIHRFLELIHDESIRVQTEVMNQKQTGDKVN